MINKTMKIGSKVRMTKNFKKQLCSNDCKAHVDEFGHCTGTVVENDDTLTVKWEASNNLKYHYLANCLEIII